MRTTTVAFALLLLLASHASAQRTIAQDTMSMSTPVAVECGFCATEAYGVVFREVGAGGLTANDFPLTVLSVSLALGAATVSGAPATCHGEATPPDPNTLVHVEIWAGSTVPDAADIHAMPVVGMPWPGEDMVFMQDMLPVMMSVPTTDGGADVNLMLNTFNLGDMTMAAPTVAAGHTYLRVVIGLADGGSSSTCMPITNAPTGFPVRDDDGVVAPHRSFIYAMGLGWYWNEALPGGQMIHGDWGIRLSIEPLPHADGGPTDGGASADTGATRDASAVDGGGADAGHTSGSSGGCSCRIAETRSGGLASIAGMLFVLALYSRKVTRPKRAGTWKSPSSGADQPAPHWASRRRSST